MPKRRKLINLLRFSLSLFFIYLLLIHTSFFFISKKPRPNEAEETECCFVDSMNLNQGRWENLNQRVENKNICRVLYIERRSIHNYAIRKAEMFIDDEPVKVAS